MAKVLAVPVQLEGYYRPSSPRHRSSQPSYSRPSISYENTVPRSRPDSIPFPSDKISPPASSTLSSPELSSAAYSAESSAPSSVTSSVCSDTKSYGFDAEDSLFFPVYDLGTATESLSPILSSEHLQPAEEESTDSPSRQSTPDLSDSEIPFSRPKPADDTFVKLEPSRHVDYLSHDWKEEDIWASWRYMVGKRKVHNNAARLENASWRTWAKKKYRLQTVSPEKLNWLKDCDVTWLYGPLSVAAERRSDRSPPSPSVSPAESKLPSSNSYYKTKPILKKRSMSEIMLQKSLSSSSLLRQATAAIESQQSNMFRDKSIACSSSDLTSFPRQSPKFIYGSNTSNLASTLSSGYQSPSLTKHIHFNDQVQQCIAVETDEDEDDDPYGGQYDADDSSSDDGVIMMSKSRASDRCASEPQTIAHLPSTTLKYKEELPAKKTGSFMSFKNSLFSVSRSLPTPSLPTNPAKYFSGAKSYVLEDDEDLAGLDWEPTGGFLSQQGSDAFTRPQFGNDASLDHNSSMGDFQLPNFNSWEDEDPAAAGLFGRAVDAVNTARDIAHVLWNVGWRR